MTALQVATDWVNRFPEAKVYPAYIRDGKFSTAKAPQKGYPLDHTAWAKASLAMAWCGEDFAVVDVDNVEVAAKHGFSLNQMKDDKALIVRTPSGGFHAIFKGGDYKRVLADKETHGFDFLSGGHGFILSGNKRPAYKDKVEGQYKIIKDVGWLVDVPQWIIEKVSNTDSAEGRHGKILEQIRTNYFDNKLTKEENWKQLTEELIPTFNNDRDWKEEAKRALVGWYKRPGVSDNNIMNRRRQEVPEGEYRLGRNNNKGIEIVKGDTFIGWTGWFITRRNWEYKDGYEEYVEFYRNATSFDLPPLTIVSPDERDKYLDNLPPAVVVEPDISLGGIGEVTMFYGETNQGKSWVGLWCAMMSKLETLYIATEQMDDIILRAKMMNADNTHIVSQPTYNDIPKLSNFVNEKNIGLVVLDVLSPMMMDENTTAEFHRVMEMLTSLTKERRFVIIHHAGKDKSKGARGTSRISDMVNRSYFISIDHKDEVSDIKIEPDKHKGLEGKTGGRLEVHRNEEYVFIEPHPIGHKVHLERELHDIFSIFLEEWNIRESKQALVYTKMWRLLKAITEMTERQAQQVVSSWIKQGRVKKADKIRGHQAYIPQGVKVKKRPK